MLVEIKCIYMTMWEVLESKKDDLDGDIKVLLPKQWWVKCLLDLQPTNNTMERIRLERPDYSFSSDKSAIMGQEVLSYIRSTFGGIIWRRLQWTLPGKTNYLLSRLLCLSPPICKFLGMYKDVFNVLRTLI